MAEDKFGFGKMLRQLKAAQVNMPKALAQTGQLYFQQNFDKKQWDGVPWEPRKKETRRSKGKALLVASGKLRQAMQRTIRKISSREVVWGIDLSYAKYLNFGTPKMVAREFLGGSKELMDKLTKVVKAEYDKIMKK